MQGKIPGFTDSLRFTFVGSVVGKRRNTTGEDNISVLWVATHDIMKHMKEVMRPASIQSLKDFLKGKRTVSLKTLTMVHR